MCGIGNLRSRQFTVIQGFLWLVFITHNLLQWVPAALFGGSILGEIGTRELVAKVGRVGARRERLAHGWRILLPPLDALARRFIQCVSPPAVQLTLPLRL